MPERGIYSMLSSERSYFSFTKTCYHHRWQQLTRRRACLGRGHLPQKPGAHHEGKDACSIFMGVAHSGLPSLHAILEDSASEDDSTSNEGESSGFPIPQGCNMVTTAIPIMTTPPQGGALAPLTIPTVPQWTAVPQPDTGLLVEWIWVYQEEQQCIL
jgi:hypothetical protein